jgi:hypothetical protein
MALKAYCIMPIDLGWDYLPTVREFAERLAMAEVDIMLTQETRSGLLLDKFIADFKEAQKLAMQVGWEGDFRGEPHVFCIPIESQIAYGFVWKQDNNGSTFVVTAEPMPWLDGLG